MLLWIDTSLLEKETGTQRKASIISIMHTLCILSKASACQAEEAKSYACMALTAIKVCFSEGIR